MGKSSTLDRVAPHATGGSPALELAGSASVATGLGGIILELVGEGGISIGSALEAWQREQDRISNRVWRRPGGMARMGGL